MPDDDIEFISREQAADILHRDIRTIDRYRRTRGPDRRFLLTTYRLTGSRHVLLDKAEVERLSLPVPQGGTIETNGED